tara:strand:+ start:35 stop:367 length:333 start_codon:yes stop_codon:yes gene_type:complete
MKGNKMMKDRRQSVQNEIRNQSLMYVQGLTLFEKNRLITKPNTHLKKVRDHIKNDKKSILSSHIGSSLKTGSVSGRNAQMIDNKKIQKNIIRKSVNHLRPNGTWYPNQEL